MSQTDSTKTSGQKAKKILVSPLKEAFSQLTKSYRFYIPNKEEMINITIDLPSNIELKEAMSRALHVAAKQNPLDKNHHNYDIYMAKKSGQPKTDFPSYQDSLRLEETGNNIFTLVHIIDVQTNPIRKSFRKSTYDLSHYQSTAQPDQQKEIKESKQSKNWFLRFLGCA